jgi:hypothetical protein
VFACGVAAFSIAAWFAMRASLYRAIDDDLESRLQDVEKFLQSQKDLSHEGVRKELGIRTIFNALGPLTAIHATFICGSAEIFDSPLNVKVRASLFPEKVSGVESVSR